MFNTFIHVVYYEVLMTLRQAHSWMTSLLFFIIVVSLFPLTLGPQEFVLKKIAPGVIWIAALLAILLSLGNLFKNDAQEGYLDLLLLTPCSLTTWVLCKVFSHWLIYGLPLVLVSPLLGLLLHFNGYESSVLLISLIFGTVVLSFIGAMGAGLMVGVRGHGTLLPVLMMPLYIPVLIFGTGILIAAMLHQPIKSYFALLGALTLFSLAFAPLVTAAALRIGVNQ